MLNHNLKEKPEIDYPTEWHYKIIGDNLDEMLFVINEISKNYTHDLTPSNISRKGKYISLNLSVLVPDELTRNRIYRKLKSNGSVKIVF